MTELDPEKGLAECAKLENEDNFELNSTISFIYSKYGGPEHFDYFKRRNAEVTRYSHYVFLQHYSMYLTYQDHDIVEEGLDILGDAAKTAQPWWVKTWAYKGLNQLLTEYELRKSDVEGQIKSTEDTGELASLDQELKKINDLIELISDTVNSAVNSESDTRVLNAIGN